VEKLRFAQIGTVMIHAPAFRDSLVYLKDDIEIVGFYDPAPDSPEVKEKIKPDVAHVPFYDTIDELIAKAKPDVVMVSGLPTEMPGWLLQAAEAGVHLWTDKPFAMHSSDLLPVKAAIEKNNLVFSCGYSWRFDPISLQIKQLWDQGLFGKPYAIDIRFLAGSIKEKKPSRWMWNPETMSGGIVTWLGCHFLDVMRYWTGSEVTRVIATEANVSGAEIPFEDAAAVSLQFANGMIGSLHTGYFLPSGNEITFSVQGSEGSAKWDVADGFCTVVSTKQEWEAAPKRKFEQPRAQLPGYGGAGANSLRAFIRELRGTGKSGFTIDDPIQSLRIIEAVHESARTGSAVSL
jgi:predicted dehydrogenase